MDEQNDKKSPQRSPEQSENESQDERRLSTSSLNPEAVEFTSARNAEATRGHRTQDSEGQGRGQLGSRRDLNLTRRERWRINSQARRAVNAAANSVNSLPPRPPLAARLPPAPGIYHQYAPPPYPTVYQPMYTMYTPGLVMFPGVPAGPQGHTQHPGPGPTQGIIGQGSHRQHESYSESTTAQPGLAETGGSTQSHQSGTLAAAIPGGTHERTVSGSTQASHQEPLQQTQPSLRPPLHAETREERIARYREEYNAARGFEDDHIYFPNGFPEDKKK
ncbi:hypothetical protein HD806DRAFT_533839 [Xylariaceae sp. AK1471]|nr:hypothetical protein HD806DRAFT_533839 [Xylariaceae sp. AK1471]